MAAITTSEPNVTSGRSILLWGGRSKARIIEAMIGESNLGHVKIIFDHTLTSADFETSAQFVNDVSVLRDSIKDVSYFVVCIGAEHGFARVKTAEYLERIGLRAITIIHPKSFVETTATIGQGCQVMPCAVVHKFAQIGRYSIINTNAAIDHECVIGAGVHVMGSAAIAGKVEIGDYATIGTNATILPYIKIGEGAYIGAGSVVTKDVDPYAVVMGVPARYHRKNHLKFSEDVLGRLAARRD